MLHSNADWLVLLPADVVAHPYRDRRQTCPLKGIGPQEAVSRFYAREGADDDYHNLAVVDHL
jgi:hypothetical protein